RTGRLGIGLHQVHLLAAGVEPVPRAEIGARQLRHAEHVAIEGETLLRVGDADGDMVYTGWLHPSILPQRHAGASVVRAARTEGKRAATATPEGVSATNRDSKPVICSICSVVSRSAICARTPPIRSVASTACSPAGVNVNITTLLSPTPRRRST